MNDTTSVIPYQDRPVDVACQCGRSYVLTPPLNFGKVKLMGEVEALKADITRLMEVQGNLVRTNDRLNQATDLLKRKVEALSDEMRRRNREGDAPKVNGKTAGEWMERAEGLQKTLALLGDDKGALLADLQAAQTDNWYLREQVRKLELKLAEVKRGLK